MKNNELLIVERDFMRLASLARGKELAEELDRATVIPAERMPRDVVRMHSRVTYVDEHSGERRDVELVFPDEVDVTLGRISVLAPVGSALLGLQEGQGIEWLFPDGHVRRLRVERARPPKR